MRFQLRCASTRVNDPGCRPWALLCWRAVGGTPGAGQRTLDAGNIRGAPLPARARPTRGHAAARDGDGLGTHRRRHPDWLRWCQAGSFPRRCRRWATEDGKWRGQALPAREGGAIYRSACTLPGQESPPGGDRKATEAVFLNTARYRNRSRARLVALVALKVPPVLSAPAPRAHPAPGLRSGAAGPYPATGSSTPACRAASRRRHGRPDWRVGDKGPAECAASCATWARTWPASRYWRHGQAAVHQAAPESRPADRARNQKSTLSGPETVAAHPPGSR